MRFYFILINILSFQNYLYVFPIWCRLFWAGPYLLPSTAWLPLLHHSTMQNNCSSDAAWMLGAMWLQILSLITGNPRQAKERYVWTNVFTFTRNKVGSHQRFSFYFLPCRRIKLSLSFFSDYLPH